MKSFIIRLKENELSTRIANDCIDQAKKFNFHIESFDGINGNNADKIFFDDNIEKYPIKLKRDTPGVKGCAASHYMLWKQCVRDQVPYLILEQDGYMIRNFPEEIVDKTIDVCKLDAANPFNDGYENHLGLDKKISVIDYDLSWGYKKKSAPYGGYFRGAWSYIIKPHAAEKLIDSFQKNGWVPADKQFGEKIIKLQVTSSTIFRIHPYYNSKNIEENSLTRNLR